MGSILLKETLLSMQTLNNYFLKRASIVYGISLVFVAILYYGNFMTWYWALMGILEVALFYGLSTYWEKEWGSISQRQFEKKLFGFTLLFRLIWIFGYYAFTTSVWNTPWEQPIGTSMDSEGYFTEAVWLKELIRQGDISPYMQYMNSDAGYAIFLALWNFVTHDSIVLSRLPNAFFDTWTVILTYRIARRNFGEKPARLAALFTLLIPMMSFYTAVTMKESLMVMLSTWALEKGDLLIRERNFKSKDFIVFVLLTLLVSFFRTALAWVIILTFVCAVLLSSNKLLNKSKRAVYLSVLVLGGVTLFGGTIIEQSEDLYEQAESTGANFEYRANRQGGNRLVANFSKGALAPLALTIPFPTMVKIEGQNIQQLQNGGFYLKNILSFFNIFAIFILLKRKKWRENVMILAFLAGYLMVLALSSFIHSGRFHHPVIPIEMILGAFGIYSIRNRKDAQLFDYFLVLEFLVILFWNGFKLRGRGII